MSYSLEIEQSVLSLIHPNRDVTAIACIADECIADEYCQVAIACDWSSLPPTRENGNSTHATEADWRCVTGVLLQQGHRSLLCSSCRHQLENNNNWSSCRTRNTCVS
jgi:hypothetical protein